MIEHSQWLIMLFIGYTKISIFIVSKSYIYLTFCMPSVRLRTPVSASEPPKMKLMFEEVPDPTRSPVCTDII